MLVDLRGKMKALLSFFSFVHLFYGIFVSLFNFFFVHVLTVSYLMYIKHKKIPAH